MKSESIEHCHLHRTMRSNFLSALLLVPAIISADEARQIHCRFLSFGGNGEPASIIAVSGKGTEITCPLPTTQISPKIVCFAKDNAIGFISSADRKPFATARIPAAINSALLVFVKTPVKPEAKSTAPAWRVLVIEDSHKNFPDGGAFVANFYSKDIRFIIGEHKGMLHAAGAHGYAMPKERDTFNMAPVVFEFQQGESWRTANEGALRFLPGMRYLIFAFVDPVSGRPRINTYQDVALVTTDKATP
jgi:hypothetical protein